jgi:hypothetical protein
LVTNTQGEVHETLLNAIRAKGMSHQTLMMTPRADAMIELARAQYRISNPQALHHGISGFAYTRYTSEIAWPKRHWSEAWRIKPRSPQPPNPAKFSPIFFSSASCTPLDAMGLPPAPLHFDVLLTPERLDELLKVEESVSAKPVDPVGIF